MSNLRDFVKTLTTSITDTDLAALNKDLGTIVSQQVDSVIAQGPVKLVKKVVQDTQVALFGENGLHLVSDTANVIKGLTSMTLDSALTVCNLIPSRENPPIFVDKDGSINARPDKVITDIHFHSEASIGDLSWLIYKAKTDTNSEITDKWKLHDSVETTSGYNSYTYVDTKNKQVAITLEGTQPNSKLSPLWLSKDGLADLEIGLGVIPAQMREGYNEFKRMVADAIGTYVTKGYGISIAGHSLGGGLAQMMSGMYFIDTGIALPTIAEAGPGMLKQLRLYAQEQLLAGQTIYLPTGGTYKLQAATLLGKIEEAKAVVSTFEAQSFSNIINLITELDPVGHVNYSSDPNKDGHVGISMTVPYLLTPREDLQDVQYTVLKPINSLNITTPGHITDGSKLLPGIGNISVTRFDRHEPDQSDALWSGTTVGLKRFDGDIGLGTAVFRDYGEPKKVWEGSQLNIPEEKIFGTAGNNTIRTTDKDTLVLGGDGNDIIIGGKGGDMLSGGAGNDIIYGGAGDDYLTGDAGDDELYGGEGNDILFGGEGNDYLDGGAGSDVLCGGLGDDILVWSAGNDLLMGNEGNDTFIIRQGVQGNAQIKWERNFTNFGNDVIIFEGNMGEDSSLLFNFADEIRFKDMKWSQQGNDIIMTDSLGNQSASVTFKNALGSFNSMNDQIDFKFTNGRLYADDEIYHVRAGAGVITALDDVKYKGNILIGSSGNDTLFAGKGNDLLFGGAGADTFVFNDNFGNDTIIGSDKEDAVHFNVAFDASEFTIRHSGNDLVIDYQKNGITDSGELTIANWYSSDNRINQFVFSDVAYKIEGNHFIKKV